MGIPSKTWTVSCAALGVAALSQFPEFAQQYRQHLAGGIGELRTVVEMFDKDAEKEGLDRQGALNALLNSQESLPRSRGESMAVTIDRYENLVRQSAQLEAAPPVLQPVHILRYPDQKILEGTWEIFKPAIPLTSAAAIWGAIGAFFATVLGRTPISIHRRRKLRKQELALEDNVEVDLSRIKL